MLVFQVSLTTSISTKVALFKCLCGKGIVCMYGSALCLVGECYQVTITSSPSSPIPFNYGNMNLTCHVLPLPPAPVYYTWTSIYQYWSTPNYVNSTPTATINVNDYRAPRFPVFYCHVHSGNMLVAEGKVTLQLQGMYNYGAKLTKAL